MIQIKATHNDANRNIYKVLQNYLPNLPKSKLEQLFRKNEIKINNIRKIAKTHIINQNDEIVVYGIDSFELVTNQQTELKKVSQQFTVIYEDDNILLVNKPNGVEVHGEENSLDNQVLSYLKFKSQDSFKPSHVGRLDKETSGLIVYGKNYATLNYLNQNWDKVIKRYLFQNDLDLSAYSVKNPLVVKGYISKDEAKKRMKFSPKQSENSKLAITQFYSDKNKKVAQLVTGRKHQIRVSLRFLNKPIHGDKKYQGAKANRLMLHCYQIKFTEFTGGLKYLNNLEFYSLPKFK
ncbi:RluA family pseudouridine synthase [Mycoplasma nasistruthionis]|uniref:RNA pseudouridylate synthase n=1 Tax=Mycoplasma nasistruthionis TaxID=353852 RepID=A0A5B7XXL4_9MOLU|nr:RluA family pseudouridine synthase [Mycoplasma nasistruthionis]QCZ36663.1 RluA family pseudouridine synthase [Mycoplasma nasistruthionis]